MHRFPARTVFALLGPLMTALTVACSSTAPPSEATASDESALTGLEHVYARPDERLCPSPACGGYWLVDFSSHNACHDQQSSTYVTGIYAGNQEVSPKCSELLTGTLAPDPRHPGFEIFLLEL
jgi:hypothetical protein